MKLSEAVKPISYIKAHASEVIRDMADNHSTVIVTLNGEAKAVLQDIAEYERNQESMALLRILALSRKNETEGKLSPAKASFRSVKERISGRSR